MLSCGSLVDNGGAFKGSIVGAIVPSNAPTCLRRDGALLCKVVITSRHALPRNPKGRLMVKPLSTPIT